MCFAPLAILKLRPPIAVAYDVTRPTSPLLDMSSKRPAGQGLTPHASVTDDDRLPESLSHTTSATSPEPSANSVIHIHGHELDSDAAQPSTPGPAVTPAAVERRVLSRRTGSIDKALDVSATSVQSGTGPAREDAPTTPSLPSSSDTAPSLRESRDGFRVEQQGDIVYELDGGIRLAGGPPGMRNDGNAVFPLETLTLPPPYHLF